MDAQSLVSIIVQRCRERDPEPHCALHHQTPLQLLVSTILSAQCTDERVNKVTPSLFQRYATAADFASADLETLESMIHSTGFFRNKAKNIRACCEQLVRLHDGQVPREMDALVALPGVARKTANVVLGDAFGVRAGIVVDTHVLRLAGRLGLSTQKQAEKVERDLMELVPRSEWTRFSHWLIQLGRGACDAKRPDCPQCFMRDVCPHIGVVWE